ncbi:MAG: hypothetical protein WCR02_05625 [Sphaerochaetaceae bacterium]|jgi:hypothetical protein
MEMSDIFKKFRKDDDSANDMNCTDAVRQFITIWPIGASKYCWQIEDGVRKILRHNGSRNHPTGASIMRRFHENREAAHIVCERHADKSFFIKGRVS